MPDRVLVIEDDALVRDLVCLNLEHAGYEVEVAVDSHTGLNKLLEARFSLALVDVMRLAHTTVVVSVPGLGDDIQAMKAGIVEIADLHVVNKADRDGADRTVAELQSMLAMAPSDARGWDPPVVSCVASTGRGVDAVFNHVQAHERHLRQTGEWLVRERRMAETRVLTLAQEIVAATLSPINHGADEAWADVARVADRSMSPRRCARALLEQATRERRRAHV